MDKAEMNKMRWNMLIVDDEPVICQGLRFTIPWNSMKIEVVGEAYSGKEALELLERRPVDIVLTDIRMPQMDGLELAQRIAECSPDTGVIIISGYDDFDYARLAIRLGVQDYLLKPVNIGELSAVVSRMVDRLEEKRAKVLEQWLIREMIDTGVPYHTEAGLRRMWPEHGKYHIVCSQLDDFAALEEGLSHLELEELRSRWKEAVTGYLTGVDLLNVSAFSHKNLLLTLVFVSESEEEPGIIELLNRTADRWNDLAALRFTLSPEKSQPLEGRQALQEALTLLDIPFIKELPVIHYNGRAKRSLFKKQTVYWEGRFTGNMLAHDNEELALSASRFFAELRSEERLLSDAAEQCRYILYGLFHRFQELEPKFEDSLSFLGQPDLRIYNSYDRLLELFMEDLKTISEWLRPAPQSRNRGLIDRAEAFIRGHLNKNLKATDAAEHIHVTPGYFSLVFRQETGKSFNEYLNGLRIEKAKELLAGSESKVFEIAEAVGYNDYKHFVFIFKKITGLTPTVYRDMLRDRRADIDPGEDLS